MNKKKIKRIFFHYFPIWLHKLFIYSFSILLFSVSINWLIMFICFCGDSFRRWWCQKGKNGKDRTTTCWRHETCDATRCDDSDFDVVCQHVENSKKKANDEESKMWEWDRKLLKLDENVKEKRKVSGKIINFLVHPVWVISVISEISVSFSIATVIQQIANRKWYPEENLIAIAFSSSDKNDK